MQLARPMAVYRLVFGLLALVAVGGQLLLNLAYGDTLVGFYSYYTNIGNTGAVVVLLVGAARLFRHRPDSRRWAVVRAVTTVSLVFIGLVFNLLLSGGSLGGMLPQVNVVVHMITPVAVLVDWLVTPPGRRVLPWWSIAVAVAVPVVYCAVALVRGSLDGFYPYPFFDPAVQGGAGGVALYLLALIVALALLALATTALGRRGRGGVEEARVADDARARP
jgi:hypothetical protein